MIPQVGNGILHRILQRQQRCDIHSQQATDVVSKHLLAGRVGRLDQSRFVERHDCLGRRVHNGPVTPAMRSHVLDRLRPESFERQVLGFVGYDQARIPQVENLASLLEVPFC